MLPGVKLLREHRRCIKLVLASSDELENCGGVMQWGVFRLLLFSTFDCDDEDKAAINACGLNIEIFGGIIPEILPTRKYLFYFKPYMVWVKEKKSE